MCDPVTLAIGGAIAGASASTGAATAAGLAAYGVVAGVVGTTVGAIGQIKQGKSQQAMYNYQAQVDKNNAKIAQSNAAQERQSGLEEARLQRIKTLQAIGSQQTAMAANGIDVTQGTALDTIEDTATMGELDSLMIQYNSERKALSYEQQANNYSNQSNLDALAGVNASKAGIMNAISSGFSGIGNSLSSAASGFSLGSGRVSSRWKGNSDALYSFT